MFSQDDDQMYEYNTSKNIARVKGTNKFLMSHGAWTHAHNENGFDFKNEYFDFSLYARVIAVECDLYWSVSLWPY